MINKKAVIKIGITGVIVLFIIGLFFILIFSSFSTSLPIDKKVYLIGDKVRMDFSDYSNYKLKITTPSTSFIKQGSSDIFLFRPTEIGHYDLKLTNEDKSYSFSFEVVSELVEDINSSINESEVYDIENISNNNSSSDLENHTQIYENVDSLHDPIRLGEKVRWIKRVNLSQTDDEIVRLREFSENISVRNSTSKSNLNSVSGLSDEVEIEYFTLEPKSHEREIQKNIKEVNIYAPDELNYTNVLSFTNISEITGDSSKIKIYWKNNDSYLDFKTLDKNGNGLIDYVEWITPHLSNQTFEIIVVTKAQHLDTDKNFISDIYDSIKEKDDTWSEVVNDGEFVRTTFEINLTRLNDITLLPRIISGNPVIEVYELNGSQKITEFSDLNNEQYNRVLLSNLSGEQNTFDLKILGGSISFDHIIDPLFMNHGDVQRGSFSMTALDQNITLTNPINTSRSFVLVSTRSTSSTPNILHVSAKIINSTRIEFTKFSTTATSVEWEVVESSNFFVQRGESTTALTTTASILVPFSTPINLTESFALVNSRMNSATASQNSRDFWTAQFINSTLLNLTRGVTGTVASVAWQVIEFDGATVNSSIVSVGASTSYVPSNLINQSTSFLVLSSRSTTTSAIDTLVQGDIMNSTTILFERARSTGTTLASFFLVSSPSLSVQSGNSLFTVNTPVNSTISALNMSRTFSLNSYEYDTITTNFGQAFTTVDLANATIIQLQKGVATGNTNNTWFAVSFGKVDDANSSVNLIYPLNNSFINNSIIYFNATFSDNLELDYGRLFVWNASSLFNQTNITLSGTSDSENISVNFSTEGRYYWNYLAYDKAGNFAFNSTNFTFVFDRTKPTINFTFPSESNSSYTNHPYVEINVTANDTLSGLTNITLYLYNSTRAIINTTFKTTSPHYVNISNLTDGIYYFNASAIDNANNINFTETRQVTIDGRKPTINFTFPSESNSSYTNHPYVEINVTANDTLSGLTNITLYLYNSTRAIINTTFKTTSPHYVNISNLTDGIYYFNASAIDNANNINFTETRQVTIDTSRPIVNLIYPSNASIITSASQTFNATFTDSLLKNTTLYIWNSSGSLINSSVTRTLSGSSDTANLTANLPYNGTFYWNFFTFDSLNNSAFNNSNYTLFYDSVKPTINFTSPSESNNSYLARNHILINVTGTDSISGLQNITIYIYNSTRAIINSTVTTNPSAFVNYTVSADGVYYFNASSTDRANNINFTETRQVTIDTSRPIVNLIYPSNASIITSASQTFNATFTDALLKNTTLYIYNSSGSLINSSVTRTLSGSSDTANLTANLPYNGTFYWNFFTFDSLNNSAFNNSNYTLFYDSVKPTINFTSPSEFNSSVMSRRSILINVTGTDSISGLQNITIYIYNSTRAIINSTVTTNPSAFVNYTVSADGVYYFNASSTDRANNINFTETRQVTIDDTNPLVTISYPARYGNYSSLPIYFNISLNEAGFVMYTLDNGVTNNTMTANASFTGFNATRNSLSDGNYLAKFYANDSAGNLNYTESVNFTLDSSGPAINIISPTNTEYNQSAILFNFSFSDQLSISRSWFSFNLTNYTYTVPTSINLIDGNYTLFIYVNDSLGNLNSTSINFSVNIAPNFTFVNSSGSSIGGNTTILSVVNGLYNLKLDMNNLNSSIYVNGFNKSGNFSITYSNFTNIDFGYSSFALSFDGMIFTNATLALVANSTHLYKCSDWNMTSLSCNSLDAWDVVMVNNIGSEFNLTLTSEDPGFTQLSVANTDILADGYASEAAVGTEYGARTLMVIANASGTNTRSLISFNLSKVPSGVIIDSANLTVRCSAETLEVGESIGVGVHLVYSDFVWSQGTGGNGGNACSGTEYCWNNQPTSSQFNASADSSVIMADGCAGINYTLNVVNSVKNAYTLNYQNISFNLRPNGSVVGIVTGDEVRLTTKEFATAALRPVLNITYHSVPKVIVLNPVSGTDYNYSSSVEFRLNSSDIIVNISSVFVNVTLPNGTTLIFNLTNISNQIYQYNYTTPILFGRYNVTFIVNNTDNYFNTSETTWFNVVDGFSPTITYNNPTESNASFYSRNNIVINVSSTDINFANLTTELFNSTSIVNTSLFYTSNGFVNITGLFDGVYYFNSTAIDSYGNKNSTQTRSVTIDSTFPLISYGAGTQVDGFNTTLNFIYVNVSVIEASEKNITFELYNTTSLVNSTTFNDGTREINWTLLIDGTYYYNVTVFDNVGNKNFTETRQTAIDTINPGLRIFEPRNINYTYNNLTINYTATDFHLESCFYTLDDGINNISLTSCRNSSFIALEGEGIIILYVNDSFGNLNISNVSYFVDSIYPQINFSLPTENNGSEFERDSIYVNVSAFDINELNITFELYNTTSLVNSTTFNDGTREINWTGLDTINRTYYYNVTLTDMLSNRNSTETRQIKLIDITNPLIILSSPLNKTYYTNMSLSLTYDSSDVNLDSCWYHIDSTANISLPSCLSDSFNVTEGQHTLYLYSNDSLGLLSRQNVTFTANESLLPKRVGILAYSEGAASPSPMRYRLWDGTSFSGELSATSPGFIGEWIKVKQSPSRDENIILASNSIDDVTIQINSTLPNGTSCWHNGTTCGKYLNLTTVSSAVNRQKGDVAYETTGENAIAVFTQANATVLYKIWNGTNWGRDLIIPQTLMTGVISYVKLASHPFRNELALIMTNTSGLNIMIWNGTDWGCQPATLPANTVSVGVWQHADLTYEQNSGDLFVANTENVATEVRYTTKLDGSCTYNSATTATMLEQGEIISVASRYESNYIMISQEDTSGAANSEDMENIVWNGTTIMALSGNDITAFTATSPNIPLGPVWAGTSNFGLAIYSDAAVSTNIDYFRYNISTNTWDGAAAGLNAVGPTAFTSEEQNINSYSFIERNRSMIIVKDSSSDLWVKYYDADSNTFGNLDGGVAFETTVSSTSIPAFDFEFNHDRSGPSIYIQSPYGYENSSTVLLNITLGELGTVCTYSIDGDSNISMASAGSKNFYSSPSLLDGQHNVTFICYDKWENSRSIIQGFTVDTTLPVVEFNDGTLVNDSSVQQNFIYVNVSVDEINLVNITYELRNSTSLVNRTSYSSLITNITWIGLIGGLYYYNVSVTDIVNFTNRTELRTINLTRISPIVNLYSPQNGSNIEEYFVNNFTFSVSGNSTIDNCSLYGNWNGGWHLNQTLTNVPQNTLINFSGVNMSNDGYYIWNVYCIDNVSVLGYNSTNFTFSTFLFADNPVIINTSQNKITGDGNVTIFWNNATHALRYRIYYSNNMSNFALLNETNSLNFTDSTFSGNKRRFYYISSWNPLGENISSSIISAQVFSLSKTSANTRNWIGFISNTSYLVSANDSLYSISNITTFSMWNASIQQRVKCTKFLCPVFPACTPTDCNFALSPGQGYEVHVNSSAVSNYNWSVVGIVNDRANITLIKNATSFAKNWISLYANTSMINAQQLYLNISNADAVSTWNSNLQTSQGLIKNPLPIGLPFIGNNFSLELEKGYEVSVNQSMNWTQY